MPQLRTARLGRLRLVIHTASLLALTASCRRRPDAVLASVDAPVRMEFIRHDEMMTGSGRGSIGIPMRVTHGFIRIHTQPVYTLGATCHAPAPELVADARGERLAYRCDRGDAWRVVYLPAPGRSLTACVNAAGNDPVVDWSRVPTLTAALPTLGACNEEVAAAVAASPAAPPMPTLLAATHTSPMPSRRAPEGDEWLALYRPLPPASAAPVRELVRQSFVAARPSITALFRAVHVLDLADASLEDAVVERARELVEGDYTQAGSADRQRRPQVRAALLHRLAQARPDVAGALGCAIFEAHPYGQDLDATIAVASGRAPCPAFTRVFARRSCTSAYDCTHDGGAARLCTQDELAPELAQHLARSPVDVMTLAPARGFADRMFLAAAYASGDVTASVERVNARRRYTIDEPRDPDCRRAPRGQPCACFRDYLYSAADLCRVPAESTEGRRVYCTFQIDDTARRITHVVSAHGD